MRKAISSVWQVAGLFTVALLMAAGYNAAVAHQSWRGEWDGWIPRQARASRVPVADWPEVRKHAAENAPVFDARSRRAYGRGHVPGAISLPQDEFGREFRHVQPLLMSSADQAWIYCDHRDCEEGLLLARQLVRMGYTNATLVVEGYAGWIESGGAVER